MTFRPIDTTWHHRPPADDEALASKSSGQEMVMAIFVDLEMSTDTALKLLKFISQQDSSDPDLCSLFSEIERQVKNSIDYESHYVQCTLHKKPTN